MLISVKKRFVFVASSKTASTAIEHHLIKHCEIARMGSPQRKHMRLHQALPEYHFLFDREGYEPETFFKFGVMRDPISWILSWHRYRTGNKVANPLPKNMTFEELWRNPDWVIRRKNGRKNLQRDFFMSPDGQMLADYIIPYEDLADHFHTIAQGLGVQGRLQKKNVSKNTQAAAPGISEDLLEEMRAFYAEDYALYNRLSDINTAGITRLKATRP